VARTGNFRLRTPPLSTPSVPSTRLEIHKDDEIHFPAFQQLIEEWTEANLPDTRITNASMPDLSNLLAALSTASLECVAKVKRYDKKKYLKARCRGLRAPFKDGFSPEMRLLQDAMHLFIRLRVAAFGPGHAKRWHSTSSYAIILPLVSAWTSRLLSHFPDTHDNAPLGLNASSLHSSLIISSSMLMISKLFP
jgi:hypothetical protein